MERDRHLFFDTYSLQETEGIRRRAEADRLLARMSERLPSLPVRALKIRLHDRRLLFSPLQKNRVVMPAYAEIRGKIAEKRFTVLVPLAWNERLTVTSAPRFFAFSRPDNLDICSGTMPKAVLNGFTAVWGDCDEVTLLSLGRCLAEELHLRPACAAYLRGSVTELPEGFAGALCYDMQESKAPKAVFLRGSGMSSAGRERWTEPIRSEAGMLTDTACMTALLNWAEEGRAPIGLERWIKE